MARLNLITWVIRTLCITSQLAASFVFVVQRNCTVTSLWTPVPSTVSNFCLQCLCTQQNFSLCRKVLVQLSPGCTTTTTVVGSLIDPRTGNITTPPVITPPVPVIPPPATAGPIIPPTIPPVPGTIVPILTPPPSSIPPPSAIPPPNPNVATNSTVIPNPTG